MFAVIRHYHFNPKDAAEIDRRLREEFVPIVKSAKGNPEIIEGPIKAHD
jgi:hypothetical protein